MMSRYLQILFLALLSFVGVSSFTPTARSYRSQPFISSAPRAPSQYAPTYYALCTSLFMAGPATLEPTKTSKKKKTAEPVKDKQRQGSEGWEVRLFNDPMNKREYVARCLTEIVGLSDGAAYQVMMQAHQFGLAAVGRYHQERAELYRDSLVEHGLVCDMVPVDDDE